jgi:hypothetical protein
VDLLRGHGSTRSHISRIRSLSTVKVRDVIRSHEANPSAVTYDMENPLHLKHSLFVSAIGPQIYCKIIQVAVDISRKALYINRNSK